MKREEQLLMFQNHHRDMFPCWVPESKLDRENRGGIKIPLHFHLSAMTWPLTPYQSRAVGWCLSRLESWLKGYSTQKCRFWIVYSTSCCSKPFFPFIQWISMVTKTIFLFCKRMKVTQVCKDLSFIFGGWTIPLSSVPFKMAGVGFCPALIT